MKRLLESISLSFSSAVHLVSSFFAYSNNNGYF